MAHMVEGSEAMQLKHHSLELWLSLSLWDAGQGVSWHLYVLPGILRKACTLAELTLFTEVRSAKRWALSKATASIQC